MTNGIESETNGIPSEATLLPCPFCGGEVEISTYRNEGYQIECPNHEWPKREMWGAKRPESDIAADIGMYTWGISDEAKAALIEAWNTRTSEQAIAATLGEDEKLLDLAHHAWSIAVCAMQGTPIPASWGDAVEKGLRERGIDVDELPYVVPDATLGGGECEWVWVESWTDTTDGRECDYAHWMPDCGCWSEYDRRFSDFDDYAEKPTGIAFCERCGKAVKR